LLADDGFFLTHDMIGRNGHMRWPEVLAILNTIWSDLDERYKYNHQLKKVEREYNNWDCSKQGFEGIRSQDILPLLIETFNFELFIAWGGLIDIFIERSFGHNFDPDKEWDRKFIDDLHYLNVNKIMTGAIKPTQMMGAMVKYSVENPLIVDHLTPQFCLRIPD
jgi:hypothetical protein